MQGQRNVSHRMLFGARSSSSYSHCPANGFSIVYSERQAAKGKEKNDDNAVINSDEDEEFEWVVM